MDPDHSPLTTLFYFVVVVLAGSLCLAGAIHCNGITKAQKAKRATEIAAYNAESPWDIVLARSGVKK